MKSIIYVVLIIAATIFFTGCFLKGGVDGNGIPKTEIRKITVNVDSIEIHDGNKIKYKIDNESEIFDIVVNADSNIIPLIYTGVENSILKVRSLEVISSSSEKIVTITGPAVSKFNLSGGSQGSMDTFSPNSFETNLSGGSQLELLNFSPEAFIAKVTGGSILTISGKTKQYSLDGSGGSEIKANNFETDVLTVILSGGSEAEVKVNVNMGAKLSGGSSLTYSGSAKVEEDLASGSSIIKK